jgi:hypothetical protein
MSVTLIQRQNKLYDSHSRDINMEINEWGSHCPS